MNSNSYENKTKKANKNIISVSKLAKDGLLTHNPILIQTLGMCPTLATTTSAANGLGMGFSTALVLIVSNFLISIVRKFIPKQVRIASYIVIISGFVAMLEMLFKAYIPALDKSLGLFIPLIAVNCIILARAEAFASRNNPIYSALDGLFMGLGFAFALFFLGTVREIIGAGTFMGMRIFPSEFAASMIVSPAGAFFSLGILIAAFKTITNIIEKKSKKEEAKK